jgi:hypothetical protein
MHNLGSAHQKKFAGSRLSDKSQRREPRHAVRPGSQVIFKKTPRFRLIGRTRILHRAELIDISMEGLRARYTASDKWSSPFDHISIATPGKDLVVSDIFCKIISDYQITYSNKGERARVCGVKFSRLTGSQKNDLQRFIGENAVGEDASAKWYIQFN